MRFILFALLLLSSFSAAILEVQNCPSLANSNFTLNVISSSEPQIVIENANEGLLVSSAGQSEQTYSYYVNFSKVPKNLYVLSATAEGSTVKCGFSYVPPELTTTKIPDSSVIIVLLSVLALSFVLFRKDKKR